MATLLLRAVPDVEEMPTIPLRFDLLGPEEYEGEQSENPSLLSSEEEEDISPSLWLECRLAIGDPPYSLVGSLGLEEIKVLCHLLKQLPLLEQQSFTLGSVKIPPSLQIVPLDEEWFFLALDLVGDNQIEVWLFITQEDDLYRRYRLWTTIPDLSAFAQKLEEELNACLSCQNL
jgi:hypothetical protein